MTNKETLEMLIKQIKNNFEHLEPQQQADFLEHLAHLHTDYSIK